MKRKPSPATIIASVALFFSLAGTGIAASHYLITNIHQIKPSVLRALHGAPGPRGPAGTPGLHGTTGPAGPQGSTPTPIHEIRSASQSVAPGATVAITVDCGSLFASGGGFGVHPGLVVTASEPSVLYGDPPDGGRTNYRWIVIVNNPTGDALTAGAWASCTS